MGITKIKEIKSTVEKAIEYTVTDKEKGNEDVVDYIDNAIEYIRKNKEEDKKIIKTYSTSINCSVANASKEMEKIRVTYNKNSKNLAYHLIQSFDEKIDSKLANEIGVKLAKECFDGFQCVVSTHNNTNHTHNHIIINAVALDGKKYNDCDKTYANIRKVSDRLCEEYGLQVIENGREYSRYEKNHRTVNGSNEFHKASDYRNYDSFKNEKIKDDSIANVLRNDIDNVIKISKNIEEFVSKLNELGWEVKYKNKSGGYLKHIAFKSFGMEKFHRGYKLGESYTLESILKRIDENIHLQQKEIVDTEHNVLDEQIDTSNSNLYKVNDNDYEYGKIDIDRLSDEYRVVDVQNGYRNLVRTEVEKMFVTEVKKLNEQINDSRKEFNDIKKIHKQPYIKDRTDYYIKEINESLACLKFVEDNKIQTVDDIANSINILKSKQEEINKNFKVIDKAMKSFKSNIDLVSEYHSLIQKIELRKADEKYVEFELDMDMDLIDKYKQALKQRNLLHPKEQESLSIKYENIAQRYKILANAMKNTTERLNEYNKCIYRLDKSDKDK